MKRVISLVFFLIFSIFSGPATGQYQGMLEKSESLMAQGDFYEALLVLKPLLTADQRSQTQEQALWLASALCETVIRDGDLMREFEEAWEKMPPDRKHLEDPMKQEKVMMLNEWGADIGFEPLGGTYDYRYGFLRRLAELYPDSKRRPAAEYYLIRRRYNEREAVERRLDELYSYVDKYGDTGLGELYMAYLDIAHINDNLWQMMTYPDGTYSEPFSSGNTELDKERAVKYKSEALKFYARAIISGYNGRFGYQEWFDTRNRFQELRQDKQTNHTWIIYD